MAAATITPASATASSAMAAAGGFDKRASTASSSLRTPGSGTFPSEMLSPMAHSPGMLRREDALRTPITPPSAYLDFLRNLTPAMSPMSTGTSARFNFNDKPFEFGSDANESKPNVFSLPCSEPALSRNTSYESTGSNMTSTSEPAFTYPDLSSAATAARRGSKPETPRLVIPPSPFLKPGPRSSRTPRNTNYPASPFSPLNTAATAPSPYITSATPTTAPWSATWSPRERSTESQQIARVSVRHVVTRTVTYCRTPLDPAPKGKRRKLADGSAPSASAALAVVNEQTAPVIKQEKIEEVDFTEESATDTDLTDMSASEAETDTVSNA